MKSWSDRNIRKILHNSSQKLPHLPVQTCALTSIKSIVFCDEHSLVVFSCCTSAQALRACPKWPPKHCLCPTKKHQVFGAIQKKHFLRELLAAHLDRHLGQLVGEFSKVRRFMSFVFGDLCVDRWPVSGAVRSRDFLKKSCAKVAWVLRGPRFSWLGGEREEQKGGNGLKTSTLLQKLTQIALFQARTRSQLWPDRPVGANCEWKSKMPNKTKKQKTYIFVLWQLLAGDLVHQLGHHRIFEWAQLHEFCVWRPVRLPAARL